MSARLQFIVEGQTEETFVNRVLAPHLGALSISACARCVKTSRKHGSKHRGGGFNRNYEIARRDIVLWMKEDGNADAFFTTMFDLYDLPGNFPGYVDAQKSVDPYAKVEKLEQAMADDIGDQRFIPYLQLHEFEALVLADAGKLAWMYPDNPSLDNLTRMAATFDSPELIDDGKETAPSKRITREIPEYERVKAHVGPVTAGMIGLEGLRKKCRHFGEWLSKLENMAG